MIHLGETRSFVTFQEVSGGYNEEPESSLDWQRLGLSDNGV